MRYLKCLGVASLIIALVVFYGSLRFFLGAWMLLVDLGLLSFLLWKSKMFPARRCSGQ